MAMPLRISLTASSSHQPRTGNRRQRSADDDRFVGVFAHELEHAGGYSNENAMRVARMLLPDILYYDPRHAACFPHNGRTLTDDVVDAFFFLLTNGKVTGDKVGPHSDLLDEFPYLGSPHDSR